MLSEAIPPQAITFRRVRYDPAGWDAIVDGYPDAEVYHGSAWLAYLSESQHAKPIVAEVLLGGAVVGHFVGATVQRFGLRILGSPLRGWGTAYMGFLLQPGVDRRAVAAALPRFAFGPLRCVHLELADRGLRAEDMTGSGYAVEHGLTYVVDLTGSDDAVLGRMRSTTRNYVRQGQRKGLTTEVAVDPEFVPEFYAQLTEVFLRQGIAPTYAIERAERMVRHVASAHQVLCLRVRAPDGATLATGIFVGRGRWVVLWGAAFSREQGDFHPNELLHWEAMRYWKGRGAERYDMGGGGDYKAKYGGETVPTAHFFRSRFGLLKYGRVLVRRLARTRQIAGAIRRGRRRLLPGAAPQGHSG